MTRRVAWPVLGMLMASLAGTSTAAAQQPAAGPPATHLLVVSGLGGAPEFTELFHQQGADLVSAATDRWGLPAGRVTWLAENPSLAPDRIAARSARDAVAQQIADLAGRARADDRVLIVLIGHGTAVGEGAKLNLPGPDLTGEDLATWLEAFPTQHVAIVNTASASGGFIAPLSAARRIVVTATRSAREAERTHFASYFVEALSAEGADTDKDRRVSLLEAFEFARAAVERFYERENLMRTEHALLDDDGDGEGSVEPTPGAGDGALAAAFYLGAGRSRGADGALTPRDVDSDPELAALVAERTRLETAIAALRARRPELAAAEYETRQEELLLSLARVNRSIRESGADSEARP